MLITYIYEMDLLIQSPAMEAAFTENNLSSEDCFHCLTQLVRTLFNLLHWNMMIGAKGRLVLGRKLQLLIFVITTAVLWLYLQYSRVACNLHPSLGNVMCHGC